MRGGALQGSATIGATLSRALALGLLLIPRALHAAQQNEFAEVVRVVVGGEQDLAKNGLAVAVGDFRE